MNNISYVYIDDPGQWMFGIGTALDGNAQNRLGLLHGDPQVALVIGYHQRSVLFPSLRYFAPGQSLSAVMPSWRATRAPSTRRSGTRATLLEELSLLHVEAPRELVREFLKRAQLRFIRRKLSTPSRFRSTLQHRDSHRHLSIPFTFSS